MPIQNERQRQITVDWLESFSTALKDMDESPNDVHPLIFKAQRDAVQSQIEVLRSDLRAYDNDQREKMNET